MVKGGEEPRFPTGVGRLLREAAGLPYPAYLRYLAFRTVLLWLLVRLVFFVLVWFGAAFSPDALHDALRQPSYGLPAFLVWLDRRFFRETLLPANLGSREGWFWVTSLAVALGMDLLAHLLLSA